MPVERIYVGDDGPNPRHVDVQWGKDHGSINLGTVRDEPDKKDATGQFLDLRERNQVNRLIRVLRKARDQAFGRDE